MYESKKQPLATRQHFIRRVGVHILATLLFITISLFIGVLGYHYFGECAWMDALHNASMILSGMGPVITIQSDAGKIFSSLFALYSGLAFITNMGLLLAPVLHRIIHKMHLDN